jgi:hypothetical protein
MHRLITQKYAKVGISMKIPLPSSNYGIVGMNWGGSSCGVSVVGTDCGGNIVTVACTVKWYYLYLRLQLGPNLSHPLWAWIK